MLYLIKEIASQKLYTYDLRLTTYDLTSYE